jgi:outer membrane lipoprotein-sorting protein
LIDRLACVAACAWLAAALAAQPASPEALTEAASPEPAVIEAVSAITATSEVRAAPSHDIEAIALLEQMSSTHSGLQALQGTFIQHKTSEMLLEEDVATGRFWWQRPGRFRYDYDASELTGESSYWFIGDDAHVYIPEFNQHEIYHLSQDDTLDQSYSRVLIGLDGAVDELLERNWVRLNAPTEEDVELGPGVTHITLIPRDGVDPDGLTQIDLWVDQQRFPAQVKMVEESGDTTVLRFTALTPNPDIGDEVFDPGATVQPDATVLEFP